MPPLLLHVDLAMISWTEIHKIEFIVKLRPSEFLVYAGILEQSLGARNRVGIGLSYWRPGYIGWRDRLLGIDS
jgi:hypothetical protein